MSSSSSSVLKLGTRKSLLAWAQSSWVAREVERLNPGLRVELVGIETRGDRIQDVSLRQVAGKEFFVAEIDDALKEGRADLTVHSMKDLSLDRPAEFVLGAVPRRENPRDVVLFGPSVVEGLRSGRPIRIGTSSPRRLENIPAFLEKALPFLGVEPRLDFVEIRGNVNTRLSRVHEPIGSERHLDAVVLAFAGLIRLWADDSGRRELSRLLDGVRWMVLPLKECPAAPAQGALAVECRANDTRVREALAKLHHEPSWVGARAERQLLEDWGGGCHQRFGATAQDHSELGPLLYIRGAKPSGEFVEELRWSGPKAAPGIVRSAWDGTQHAGGADGAAVGSAPDAAAWFVAHSRAMPADWMDAARGRRVWASGTRSWIKLARQGVWVEGCAEGTGFAGLSGTLGEGVLGLPAWERWAVLTHESAREGWTGARVYPTYQVKAAYDAASKAALAKASHLFWSSGSQWDELRNQADPKANHACGAGKTAAHLRAAGIQPVVFPSVEEWKKWLGMPASV